MHRKLGRRDDRFWIENWCDSSKCGVSRSILVEVRHEQVECLELCPFDFALTSLHVLAPRQRAVIVQDIAKCAKYHDVHTITVLGQYDGKLANEGETLTVVPVHSTVEHSAQQMCQSAM